MRRGGIWLTAPTRFASLSRTRARLALALVAALLLACLGLGSTTHPAIVEGRPDSVLYEDIVETLRRGDSYYPTTAEKLRQGELPLKPFTAFRLPTLTVILSAIPTTIAALAFLLLSAGVIWAWYRRLTSGLSRAAPRIAVALLAGAGLSFVLQSELVVVHEAWAAALITLSLALWRPTAPMPAIGLALCAVLIRETAILYIGVMAAGALMDGRRRELVGWAAATAVFLVVVMAHAWAVSQVVRPLDPASSDWFGLAGFGVFVEASIGSTALAILPGWIASLLAGLSLLGWLAWRDPLATRTLAALIGYALLLAIVGRPDEPHWGLLVAPILLIGLVFAPDAVRDILSRALDTRRVTITRITR